MKTIRWIIAHEPQHLFLRTATAFSEKIAQRTNGEFQLEVLTEADYKAKYCPELELDVNVLTHISEGRCEMGHTFSHRFSGIDTNFQVFDMPFLFKDHEHASRVFDGEIGQAMCERLSTMGPVRGLCFTYSGGYRVIGSNTEITNLEDLAGISMRVNGNSVNYDFMEEVGAKPLVMITTGYDVIEEGAISAAETTYLRFKGKYVFKTNHNLFLTVIAMSNKLWNTLDEETQTIFLEVAAEVARLEREWSIQDAKDFELNCAANGITLTEITSEDLDKLKDLSNIIYDRYVPLFSPGLIEAIQAEGN